MVSRTDDSDGLLARVDELGRRFEQVLSEADPEAAVPAAPGWTVHDVAAHMVTVVRRYGQGPRGEGDWVRDPVDLPGLNQRLIDELGPTTMDDLVRQIREETSSVIAQIDGYGAEPPAFEFNGGEQVRADDALGLLAGEFLVHGHDIAEASARPWPISAEDVETVLRGAEQVLPGFVDRTRAAGHSATYVIHVVGGSAHTWRFDDGQLHCGADAGGPVDCHVRGRPGALLLVMYGRVPAWRAALTGKVLAWGRRPWLGLSLADRFHNP